MKNLKIAAVALDMAWADRAENLFMASRACDAVDRDTDIVVFPELFTTSFVPDARDMHALAEEERASQTLATMRHLAASHNFAVCGSSLVREGDAIYNRCYFVEPSGEVTHYDKRHLFSLSAEHTHCSPGKDAEIPVIRYRGFNIALAVCYDLRFPAWLRNRHNRYDVLLVPANWPTKRHHAWYHLLMARAIENQAYVVGANRAGRDDYGTYENENVIFDFKGQPIALPEGKSDARSFEICTGVCDRDALADYRKIFPVIDDADEFKFV